MIFEFRTIHPLLFALSAKKSIPRKLEHKQLIYYLNRFNIDNKTSYKILWFGIIAFSRKLYEAILFHILRFYFIFFCTFP